MVLVVLKLSWASSNLVCRIRRVDPIRRLTRNELDTTCRTFHRTPGVKCVCRVSFHVVEMRFTVHIQTPRGTPQSPVIAVDYCESWCACDLHNFRMLAAVDTSTAVLNAGGVQSKGPNDKYAIEAMTTFIQDLGHTTDSMPSTGEPETVAMLEALRDRVCRHESTEKVVIQAATVHSHQSVGHSVGSCSDVDTRVAILTDS